jgi:hypothetical protein
MTLCIKSILDRCAFIYILFISYKYYLVNKKIYKNMQANGYRQLKRTAKKE